MLRVKLNKIKIKNGDIWTFLIFYGYKIILDDKEFFKHYKKFETAFKEAFNITAKEYKGFPSPLHKCKFIEIFIKKGRHTPSTSRYNVKNNSIRIKYGFKNILEDSGSNITAILLHELLHIVAQIYENQDKLIHELKKYEANELKALKKGINIFNKHLRKINTPPATAEYAPLEYKYIILKFWNRIADMALSIIAAELKSNEFFTMNYLFNKKILKGYFTDTEYINNKYIENKNLKNMLNFMQYINAIISLPVEILPYSIIEGPHKNQANGLVREYINITQRLLPEVRTRIIKVLMQIRKTAIEQSRFFNPKDPNLKREIHNLESIRQARRAYGMIRRDAHELLKKLDFESK